MIALEVTYPSTNRLQPVAHSVPIGQRGLVHIWGRNDTSVTQDLGIAWVIKDPDGIVVEEYSDWSYGHGPGDDHEFIGGRFDLDKEGTYTLDVDLLMGSPDDPVVVDSYKGDLCTTTVEIPPEFELIQHTVYPFAYIYNGDIEVTTLTFTSDPFTPANWIAKKVADAIDSEGRKEGGKVLEVKVYVDTTPLLWKDFIVEITGTPLGEASPMPLWAIVVIVALSISLLLFAITYTATKISSLFKSKPGLEDVKVGWDKETLIKTIQDSEEYWERPPTPIETLEAMSEEELRDYLDQIAEEEVVPEKPSVWPWIVLGAAGIVAGGLVLSRMERRK